MNRSIGKLPPINHHDAGCGTFQGYYGDRRTHGDGENDNRDSARTGMIEPQSEQATENVTAGDVADGSGREGDPGGLPTLLQAEGVNRLALLPFSKFYLRETFKQAHRKGIVRPRRLAVLFCAAVLAFAPVALAENGVTATLPNGRMIHPAGNWIPLAPYPFALAVRPDGGQIAIPSIGFPFALNVITGPSSTSPTVQRMPAENNIVQLPQPEPATVHIFLRKDGYERDEAVVPSNKAFKTDMVKAP